MKPCPTLKKNLRQNRDACYKEKDSIKPWDMTKCVFFFQLISEKWPATILKIKVQKGGGGGSGSGSGSGGGGGGGVHSDATEEPF